LLARLDAPEPFVDVSGDLCEDIVNNGVLQFGRLLTAVASMLAEIDERRRKRINVVVPSGGRRQLSVTRS
jgi:hypothetical protein